MSQLLHLAALKVRLQQLEQLGLQGLVHQNVGALGGRHQRGAGDSVTADHDGAALVVKTVANGWLDGCVVDAKGCDFQTLVVEDDHRISLANRGQREGKRFAAASARGKDFFTVVRNAVSKV